MKRFQVRHQIGGVAFIEADRRTIEEHLMRFYQGEKVVAEFATASLLSVMELTSAASQRIFERPDEGAVNV